MTPDLIFYIGLAIGGGTVIAAVIAMIVLVVAKRKLNKRLDAEYGKPGYSHGK